MFKTYLEIFCLLLIALFSAGCTDDNGVTPDPASSVITGSALHLDGSPGVGANIQLRKLSSSILKYSTTDANGVYSFDSLGAGDYVITFRSSNADVHSFEVELQLNENQTYEQDVFILYKKVDEFSALKKNRDVFLIKYDPDGGKIGDNHQYVDYLNGYFVGDFANQFTLSCDIYKTPESLDWSDADSLFLPEHIRQNYELITSIDETTFNGVHEIRFYGDDLVKILSGPGNGFIFVNKSINEKELMIPCVDFQNNDFGLLINYKE